LKSYPRLAVLSVTGLVVAACETSDSGPGLSNNITPPAGMEAQCIDQAARYAGVSTGSVVVLSRIETGGGPLITLNAAGQNLSCRREANGVVTVFSEFAN
jgi:hypothetical protein